MTGTNLARRDALILGAAAVPASAAAKVAAPAMALTLAFTVRATLAPPVENGIIDGKRKRFIGITGGTITGPKLNGTILPGGGDWQAIHDDGLTEILARYSVRAQDGTVINITNPGVRVAAPEVIKRLAAGEDVDPALYYFRSTPSFDVTDGTHGWLRRRVFVARGIRRPDHVIIEIFEVS